MMRNAQQIQEWNGPVGEIWVKQQAELDRMAGPFGDAALAVAAAQPGERVIDVGCGCGATSIALAEAVGVGGLVLGLDISQPMLDVAARSAAGMNQLSFRRGDAAVEALSPDHDLIYSRFGVMFFDDPAAAFVNLRSWLKPGGRMVFCCWRQPRDNPWGTVPAAAARQALRIDPAPMDPDAPGPFAFADVDRVRGLMERAGFDGFNAAPFDASIPLGRSPLEAAEKMTRVGPASRVIREAGEHTRPRVVEAVAKALEDHAAPDGSVSLSAAVWIVSATVA